MQVILRHKGKDAWANVIKYKNCFDYISPYWTRSGNKYTGLTEEETKRLEKALGFAEGVLAPHSDYWSTFTIKLGDKELTLDTDNPWDELRYIFLKGHKRVAASLSEVRAGTDYILINKESEAIETNKINQERRKAIKAFDKMSIEDMRKCLRLYGYKSDTMSNELIENKLFTLVEENPSKFFLKWVDNASKEIEVIIEQAIAKNIMRKNRNVYYHGTDIIGNSLQDCVAYLNSPANQDLKITIIKEIESK